MGVFGGVFGYLQVVEDEEEGLGGEALVELDGVRVGGGHLVVVVGGGTGVAWEVLPGGGEKNTPNSSKIRQKHSELGKRIKKKMEMAQKEGNQTRS